MSPQVDYRVRRTGIDMELVSSDQANCRETPPFLYRFLLRPDRAREGRTPSMRAPSFLAGTVIPRRPTRAAARRGRRGRRRTRQFRCDGLRHLEVLKDGRQDLGCEALELRILAGVDFPFQELGRLLVVRDLRLDVGTVEI